MRQTESPALGASGAGRWPTALASLAVGSAFFALWFWLLPQWLGFRPQATMKQPWRWLGAAPSIAGFAVALRCVWDFGWTGRGTPAPVAPPQRLVVVGFYRYVRNPMYLGFAAGWLGLCAVFGHADLASVVVIGIFVVPVHLFVVLYEEPALGHKFAAEYEEYCRNVGRWWPRLRPWTPPNPD